MKKEWTGKGNGGEGSKEMRWRETWKLLEQSAA